MKYRIGDSSGYSVRADSIEEAVSEVLDWHNANGQWEDDDDAPAYEEILAPFRAEATPADSVELMVLVDRLCQALAEAAGHKDWAGHGNYFVSAASAGGFNLCVEEVYTFTCADCEEEVESEEEREEGLCSPCRLSHCVDLAETGPVLVPSGADSATKEAKEAKG